MKVIIGLGNPGEKYKKSRHNAGEFYLEKLARAWSDKYFSENKDALWLEIKIAKEKVFLIFPIGMMNNSGESLKKALSQLKLKVKPADVLVLHDDLDIGLGRIKMSYGRSSAGHNGVESVIKNLKTEKFWRLRLGIAPKKALPRGKSRGDGKKLIDFLLKKLSPAEERTLNKNFKKVAEGLEIWLSHPDKAMTIINS